MNKKMLINATHAEENRVAIVEDGILSELDIEIVGQEQTRGNIYKGVISRVEPGLQAAFIDFGSERSGFLQLGEIHPSLYPPKDESSKDRPRINDILRRGQELLVQVVKEERGTKGAALTTHLSLPGRYMVLMPQSNTKGISRKITEEGERKKLKAAMVELQLPEEMGYIIRTAGIGKEASELKRDLNYLLRLFENIQRLTEKSKAPALVYRESNLVIRSIRDYFTPEIDEVLIDDPKVYNETREFFQQLMPEYAKLVKLHQERRPIYSRYQIEEQIESITQNKVNLPSGGSIVIDPTEALVAIDVNSGKMASEKGVEATAYKTNLESVQEVARQLRLRDLGGLVVIDLIDMRDRKHIREVEKTLKQALKDDKARVTVGRISQFGLLEMSRQRIKSVLGDAAYLICPHCHGSGRLMTGEARAVGFMRRIQAGVAKGQIGKVIGKVPIDVAAYLLNRKRKELHDLEQRLDLHIQIEGHSDYLANQLELELIRRKEMDSSESRSQSAPATAEAVRSEGVDDEELATSPTEDTEKQENGATESTEATEGEPKKRRRRRRRRRSRSSENNTEATAEASGETSQEGSTEVKPEGEVKAEPVTEEVKTDEAVTERPKRPRRSRRKPVAVVDVVNAGEQTQETAPAETAETPAEEKPKRPRRPRRKAEEKPEAAPATETAGAPAEEKPKRTRRPRKKAEESTEAAPVAETAETPAEEKPKRTRRPRKKAEETTEAASATETAEASVEEKPKRTRRPRKKAEESTEAAPVAQAAEAPTEEKPKRPRRPRKKVETAEAAPAAESAEAPKEEKPKRTRRPRKKAEEPAQEASEAPSTESAEEKPKRTRRPRKKAEEPTTE